MRTARSRSENRNGRRVPHSCVATLVIAVGTLDACMFTTTCDKQVMAEIIAKSKTAKRERAKEKEEDDEQLDALDLTFKALADVRAVPFALCCRGIDALMRARNSPSRPGRRAAKQPSHISRAPEVVEARGPPAQRHDVRPGWCRRRRL